MTEWSKAAIEALIDGFRGQECLYNNKLTLYHNKHARKSSLDKVVEAVKWARPETTESDVKKKWTSLRTAYNSELAKIRKSGKSGTGFDELHKPTVWWFPLLHFLRDYIQPRKSESNLEESTPSVPIIQQMKSVSRNSLITEEWDDGSQDNILAEEVVEISTSQDSEEIEEYVAIPTNSHAKIHPCHSNSTPSQKRKKYDTREEEKLINQAAGVLSNLDTAMKSKLEHDEFGNFVAYKMQQYNKRLLIKVQHQIMQTLMEADNEQLAFEDNS